jgi:hypothetical protein
VALAAGDRDGVGLFAESRGRTRARARQDVLRVELGELPPLRVASFPYSVIPHPMLVGNIIAFGATLLHPEFRQAWWPLAVGHVALNLGLIVMETSVTPAHARSQEAV